MSRSRDLRVDSATGALIILVVWGHFLLTMRGDAAHIAVLWVYMFHVPAFVFVSGYVTRFARTWSPATILSRLLFPYVIFAIFQRVATAVWTGDPLNLKPAVPPWTMWYLVALLAWRLAAPLFQRASFLVGVCAATALSIVAAAVPWIGPEFSLGRIFGLLPFFVAGLLWREEWWTWLLTRWARIFAVVALLLAAVAASPLRSIFPRVEFQFSQSLSELGFGPSEAMLHRAAVLAIAAVLALSAISLLMRVMPILPTIGVASLTVYLLHAVVLLPWHWDGAPSWFSGPRAVVAALVLSALLAFVFSRKPVVAVTRPVMDMRWWQERGRALRTARRRP